jgi:hypothetical protein
MATSTRTQVFVAITAALGASVQTQGADPPSIADFKRDYRAAHDRQIAATDAVKVVFHRATESLPMSPKPGQAKPAVEKSKEQIEKEQERERRIQANNRHNQMDLTYSRTGSRQRLDIKGRGPDGQEWARAIVVAGEGSFAASTKPGAREYALEYFERVPQHTAGSMNQALVFVNASRQVGPQDAADVLLGEEFQITKVRTEQAADAGGEPIDRLVAEVRRIKPPKPSRVPRHIVGGTLTFEPARDYRLVAFVLDTNDGFVSRGIVEYAASSGPRSLIPSKSIQEILKEGDTHRGVQTYTTKEVSFDPVPDVIFTPKALGIDTRKPEG